MDTPFSFWRGMSPLNYHSPSFTRVYPVEPPLLIPLVLHPSVVANLGGLLGWRASNASGGIHNCTWWRDSTWYNLVQNGMNTMDIYGFFFPQVTESMHVLWRFEAKAEMDIRRFSCATTKPGYQAALGTLGTWPKYFNHCTLKGSKAFVPFSGEQSIQLFLTKEYAEFKYAIGIHRSHPHFFLVTVYGYILINCCLNSHVWFFPKKSH
jgi:hypothetical protein